MAGVKARGQFIDEHCMALRVPLWSQRMIPDRVCLKPWAMQCSFRPGMLLHAKTNCDTNGFFLEEWTFDETGSEGRAASIGSNPASRIRAACSRLHLGMDWFGATEHAYFPFPTSWLPSSGTGGMMSYLFGPVPSMPMLDASSQLTVSGRTTTMAGTVR